MTAVGLAVVAAALVAVSVALVVAPARPALATSSAYAGGGRGRSLARSVSFVAPGAVAGMVMLEGASVVVALVAAGCGFGLLQAWRRQAEARIRDERRGRVVEVGEAMVGELRAGQPPVAALSRAAEVWPDLGPVAVAARLGADVPTALRVRARLPGAEGLAELAAAWQVSQRSGAALTTSLGQVVESARARQVASHLVRSELSSARATARLVALLPLGTLAMSAGIGGSPWSFLTGHPVGLGCLAAGTALVFAGLAWIDRIAASVGRS